MRKVLLINTMLVLCRVSKPGLVKARVLGFDRIVRVNFNLKKKSKRHRFSKNKSTGCNRVFDRVLPGQPGPLGF